MMIFLSPQFISEHVKYHEKEDNLIVDGPAINIRRVIFPLRTETSCWRSLISSARFCDRQYFLPERASAESGGFDEKFGTGFGWYDLDRFPLMAMG